MELYPYALMTTARCASILNIDEDIEDLVPYINYASAGISAHCGRRFVRAPEMRVCDSYGDGKIMIAEKPLISVTSIYVDTARLFPESTRVTEFVTILEKGIILLSAAPPRNELVIRVVFESGYSRVSYNQDEEPDGDVVGEIWVNGSNQLFIFNGTAWIPYVGVAMPFDLEGACAEYVAYLKTRFRAGMSGIVKRERGYSFEGSAIEYEKTMPSHVRDRLVGYVAVNI